MQHTLLSYVLSYIVLLYLWIRAEQDNEPEKEVVSEVVGPGLSEESTADGMWLTLQIGSSKEFSFCTFTYTTVVYLDFQLLRK